jgi:hypothetical protein
MSFRMDDPSESSRRGLAERDEIGRPSGQAESSKPDLRDDQNTENEMEKDEHFRIILPWIQPDWSILETFDAAIEAFFQEEAAMPDSSTMIESVQPQKQAFSSDGSCCKGSEISEILEDSGFDLFSQQTNDAWMDQLLLLNEQELYPETSVFATAPVLDRDHFASFSELLLESAHFPSSPGSGQSCSSSSREPPRDQAVGKLRKLVEDCLRDLYDHDYLRSVEEARRVSIAVGPGRETATLVNLMQKINSCVIELRGSIILEAASALMHFRERAVSTRRKRSLPPKISRMLSECFQRNQYPSPEEKAHIAELTGLTINQVITWFGNRRSRSK